MADMLDELAAENSGLRKALHDAIARPMGVVPDSALEYYEPHVYYRNVEEIKKPQEPSVVF